MAWHFLGTSSKTKVLVVAGQRENRHKGWDLFCTKKTNFLCAASPLHLLSFDIMVSFLPESHTGCLYSLVSFLLSTLGYLPNNISSNSLFLKSHKSFYSNNWPIFLNFVSDINTLNMGTYFNYEPSQMRHRHKSAPKTTDFNGCMNKRQ